MPQPQLPECTRSSHRAAAGASPLAAEIDKLAAAVEPELLEWRRHLHQHPGAVEPRSRNREVHRGAAQVFGLEPKTGVARTGVVALLKGGRPGPVVALRADMDGLPVREEVDVPFASKATAKYEGQEVGVMHACGHDTHVAILLATARVLTQVKDRLPGTREVHLPARGRGRARSRASGRRGADGQGRGAADPKVDAIFGLHVFANVPTGHITYRSGSFMAAADIARDHRQGTADPRLDAVARRGSGLVGSQIVTALQTIVSRNVDITRLPAIVTVGQFQSGVRYNIIPDTARLVGTIRTFDDEVQADIHARIKRIAEGIASGAGATVDVKITKDTPVTSNDPALTAKMLPTLERVAPGQGARVGADHRRRRLRVLPAQVPGLFFFLGITPPAEVGRAPANHSPLLLRRRIGAHHRRPRADAPGRRLSLLRALAVRVRVFPDHIGPARVP